MCEHVQRKTVQFFGEGEGEGPVDARCYAYVCSAVHFQLFLELHWPDFAAVVEGKSNRDLYKASFSGGPSRCVLLSSPWLGDCCQPNAGKFFLNQNLVLS